MIGAARWALQPKDWLRLMLTGDAATDPSDASGTLLYDVVAGGWSEPRRWRLRAYARISCHASCRHPRSAASRAAPRDHSTACPWSWGAQMLHAGFADWA